jgi:hypothetical protein
VNDWLVQHFTLLGWTFLVFRDLGIGPNRYFFIAQAPTLGPGLRERFQEPLPIVSHPPSEG